MLLVLHRYEATRTYKEAERSGISGKGWHVPKQASLATVPTWMWSEGRGFSKNASLSGFSSHGAPVKFSQFFKISATIGLQRPMQLVPFPYPLNFQICDRRRRRRRPSPLVQSRIVNFQVKLEMREGKVLLARNPKP